MAKISFYSFFVWEVVGIFFELFFGEILLKKIITQEINE
jgi:hypothetical protein